jgi:hypothetical protein
MLHVAPRQSKEGSTNTARSHHASARITHTARSHHASARITNTATSARITNTARLLRNSVN